MDVLEREKLMRNLKRFEGKGVTVYALDRGKLCERLKGTLILYPRFFLVRGKDYSETFTYADLFAGEICVYGRDENE